MYCYKWSWLTAADLSILLGNGLIAYQLLSCGCNNFFIFRIDAIRFLTFAIWIFRFDSLVRWKAIMEKVFKQFVTLKNKEMFA